MTEPTTPAPPDDMPFDDTPPANQNDAATTFPVTFTGAPGFNTLRLHGEGTLTLDGGDAIVEAEQHPPSAPPRTVRFMFPLAEVSRIGLNDGALVLAIEPHEQPGKTHTLSFYVASEEDAQHLLAILRPPQAAGIHDDHPDASRFFQSLRRIDPVATYALLIANIAVFALMALSGVGVMNPSETGLIRWGARFNPLIVEQGQWWRLITPMFVHIGLLHLAMNMWALKNLGDFVERLFGSWRFLTIYFVAGIVGDVASFHFKPEGTAAGASGAIFGILGALTAFIYRRHHAIPRQTLSNLRSSAFSFIILNLALGFSIPGIDNSAHLGGLVSGFVLGWLLARPLPAPEQIPLAGFIQQKVTPAALALVFVGLMALGRQATDPKTIEKVMQEPMTEAVEVDKADLAKDAATVVTKLLRREFGPSAPACEEVTVGEEVGKNRFRAEARLARGKIVEIQVQLLRGGIEVSMPDDTKIE